MKKISEETNKNITETFLDNGNDGVVQKRSLDVSPILENNKRLYTQNDGYSPDKGLKRVATIPTIILEIWTNALKNKDIKSVLKELNKLRIDNFSRANHIFDVSKKTKSKLTSDIINKLNIYEEN